MINIVEIEKIGTQNQIIPEEFKEKIAQIKILLSDLIKIAKKEMDVNLFYEILDLNKLDSYFFVRLANFYEDPLDKIKLYKVALKTDESNMWALLGCLKQYIKILDKNKAKNIYDKILQLHKDQYAKIDDETKSAIEQYKKQYELFESLPEKVSSFFIGELFDIKDFKVENTDKITKYTLRDKAVLENKHTGHSDKKLNMSLMLGFGTHRSGWNYVIENGLFNFHNSHAETHLDGFLENTFVWYLKTLTFANQIPYKQKWIGFMHNPPQTPPWFGKINKSNDALLGSKEFKNSLDSCAGIYTLSKYHADYLKNKLNNSIEINYLYHPTEIPAMKFDMNKFLNKRPRLLNIGMWLRKQYSFYKLRTNLLKTKIQTSPDLNAVSEIILKKEHEIFNVKVNQEERDSVMHIHRLSDDDYDYILSKSIVFLDLYDSSATNTVIECMARQTPILVNKLPAVVEYLGEDYPLYYDNLEEAEEKMRQTDLIYSAHEYLGQHRIIEKIKIERFIEDFQQSSIYSSL